MSATLGVSQDQTLFVWKETDTDSHITVTDGESRNNKPMVCLNDQGGMAVVYRGDAITSPINASNPRPGDPCHTLTDDSRNYLVQGADVYNGALTGDVAATLTEACGGTNTSGAKVVCLEGNGSRPSHQGDGWHEGDPMYTLNSTEHHAVCYGICSYDSNSMRSKNPHSGFYEAKTSRTLDLNGGSPACNQGGVLVVEIHKPGIPSGRLPDTDS